MQIETLVKGMLEVEDIDSGILRQEEDGGMNVSEIRDKIEQLGIKAN